MPYAYPIKMVLKSRMLNGIIHQVTKENIQ